MSAKRHLNPSQFRLEPDENESHHWLTAYHPDFGGGKVPVGEMSWNRHTGEVANISVADAHQRQGIGTMLWNEAPKYGRQPLHSQNQLGPGKKWAKKVGGDTYVRNYLG